MSECQRIARFSKGRTICPPSPLANLQLVKMSKCKEKKQLKEKRRIISPPGGQGQVAIVATTADPDWVAPHQNTVTHVDPHAPLAGLPPGEGNQGAQDKKILPWKGTLACPVSTPSSLLYCFASLFHLMSPLNLT